MHTQLNPNIVATRWNADHDQKIEVRYAEGNDFLDVVYGELTEAGCRFYTTDEDLRTLFDLGEIEDADEYEHECKEAILQALRSGDHVFYMVHGEHGSHSFNFTESSAARPRFSDSWVAGFVVVNRKEWRKAFPNRPASRLVVLDWLEEKADWLEHELNGWIYEYVHMDEEGFGIWSGPFLTSEDALKDALEEHSGCRYSDEDFEETRIYRLKAA